MISDGFVDNQNSFYPHPIGKNLTKVAVWWFYMNLCKKCCVQQWKWPDDIWSIAPSSAPSEASLSCQTRDGFGHREGGSAIIRQNVILSAETDNPSPRPWMIIWLCSNVHYTDLYTSHYTAEYCFVIQSECWGMQTQIYNIQLYCSLIINPCRSKEALRDIRYLNNKRLRVVSTV